MKSFLLKKINKIEIKDLKDFIVFIFLIPISIVFSALNRLKKKKIWLVCEDNIGANDNGYVFYEYMRDKHEDIDCYYVIDYNSELYSKVARLGNCIKWGSVKHWIYYLSANVIISTQMGSAPNRHILYSLEIIGILRNNRVFLQHGITLNYYPSLEYKNNKLRLFICGAEPEYKYVKKTLHFPAKHVVYTGFARFDKLHACTRDEKLILIMPTWRSWIVNDKNMNNDRFRKTEFYIKYNNIINDSKLKEYIEKNDYHVVFYLHRAMQNYVDLFTSKSKNIEIVKRFDKDIQTLLRNGAFLITDYSSVSMDFAYMKKPLVYYQFDEQRFRKEHGMKGYFSYKNDGFGPVVNDEKALTEIIIDICEHGCVMQNDYLNNVERFYAIYDNKNCERIYLAIKSILQ